MASRCDGSASSPMFDDGAHGDGLANDGVFGAILPAQANTTIVEFYLTATDLENNTRAYPNWTVPGGNLRTANLLYQVDNTLNAWQTGYQKVQTDFCQRTKHRRTVV